MPIRSNFGHFVFGSNLQFRKKLVNGGQSSINVYLCMFGIFEKIKHLPLITISLFDPIFLMV